MELRDSVSGTVSSNHTGLRPSLYVFVAASTLLGAAHHVDHVVRGNHVGWPVTPEITPFTYSLVIYPLLAVSLALSLRGRVGAGYWAGFFAFSTGMLAYFHLSPWAVEPPRDVMLPYANPLVGYLAFGVLLALVGSVLVGSAYGLYLWARDER